MRVSVAFIVLALFLAACSGGKRYVVGVSQCSVDNWREKFNNELRTSAYLYDNVTLDIVSANDDDRQQVEQINRLVDKGVDLLIVSPNQVNSIMEALRHASNKGIPVIFFDRKALTGQTPVELVRTARLRKAEQLLAHGEKTVAEIAYEVGFSSPSYFTKCYKDFFGHTPNGKR